MRVQKGVLIIRVYKAVVSVCLEVRNLNVHGLEAQV